ncbi:hypothetical protein GCM10009813_18040 [Brevibacterium marinum]
MFIGETVGVEHDCPSLTGGWDADTDSASNRGFEALSLWLKRRNSGSESQQHLGAADDDLVDEFTVEGKGAF